MARKRLIGEDGGLFLATPGAEKTGNGTKTFDTHNGGGTGSGKGWWKITGKAATSSFFGDVLQAGDLHYDAGTGIMKADDKAMQLSNSEIANVVTWGADVSRNEIEMTTLHDKVKRYVYGKADWSGSIDGVLDQAQTDFVKRFVDTIDVSSAGVATKMVRTETPIDFLGYQQKHTESGLIEQFLYLPSVELGGFTFGASDGTRQEFSCPWRFGVQAAGTPQMYKRAVA